MAFLTAEQIRAVRIKGSKLVSLPDLDKQIRVVKMSSGRALEAGELQKAVKEGQRKQADMLLFMLEYACADVEGNMISHEDALVLFELLPMESFTTLVNEVNALMTVPAAEPGPVSVGKG